MDELLAAHERPRTYADKGPARPANLWGEQAAAIIVLAINSGQIVDLASATAKGELAAHELQ